MTHYEVLGVGRRADAAEVRRGYLRMARRHHPDFHAADGGGRPGAELRMRRVNEAWAVLGDAASRRAYDLELARAAADDGGDGAPGRTWQPIDDGDTVIDPRLLEEDVDPSQPNRGVIAVAPAGLLLVAVGLGSLAVVVGLPALWAGAAVALALSGVMFLILPIVAMVDSRRRELG